MFESHQQHTTYYNYHLQFIMIKTTMYRISYIIVIKYTIYINTRDALFLK